MSRLTRRIAPLGALLLVLLAGCRARNPYAPGTQMNVTNATDNLQFQLLAISDLSTTLTYDWVHSADSASLSISPSPSSGTALITIEDANGTQIFNHSLLEGGTFTVASAGSGDWTVRVILGGFNGNLGFHLQTP